MMKNIKDHVEITQHGFRFVLDEETVANETELKERAGIGNLYDEIPKDKAMKILGRDKVDQLLGFLQVGLNRAPKRNRETKDGFNAIRKAYEEQSANLRAKQSANLRAKQFDKDYPPQDLKETTADDSISI